MGQIGLQPRVVDTKAAVQEGEGVGIGVTSAYVQNAEIMSPLCCQISTALL